jgi:hypothetical protein
MKITVHLQSTATVDWQLRSDQTDALGR